MADDIVGRYPEGKEGIVSKAWMAAHRIPSATVIEQGSGWGIHRMCVRTGDFGKTWEPLDVTELVGRDGSYSRTEVKASFKPPSAAGWRGIDGLD